MELINRFSTLLVIFHNNFPHSSAPGTRIIAGIGRALSFVKQRRLDHWRSTMLSVNWAHAWSSRKQPPEISLGGWHSTVLFAQGLHTDHFFSFAFHGRAANKGIISIGLWNVTTGKDHFFPSISAEGLLIGLWNVRTGKDPFFPNAFQGRVTKAEFQLDCEMLQPARK
jgi:hypothetical protein